MTKMDIDESLREQSKQLLRKLKEKQGRLQSSILETSVGEKPFLRNISNTESSIPLQEQLDTSLKKTVTGLSSKNGRTRLQRKRTKSFEGRGLPNGNGTGIARLNENKENMDNDNLCKPSVNKSIPVDSEPTVSYGNNNGDRSETLRRLVSDVEQCQQTEEACIDETDLKSSETPTAVRRRKIIDQNVKVMSDRPDLNASELMREVEDEFPRLNYSYSNVEDSDLCFLQERFGSQSKGQEGELDAVPVKEPASDRSGAYSKNLENPGNSRKFAKFIRDTKKPKSILLSTSQRQNKSTSSSSSRVSFVSPSRDSSHGNSFLLDSNARQTHRMLGYDWIAALLENDSQAVNQSETFFEELKEFRKLNLQECVNDMYMDGPQQLWEHPEKEPVEVQQALEETKVKPYMVNDRLFPEPIKKNMFADYDYQEGGQREGGEEREKQGTYEEPRFVRVSIPRSTLLPPHRVKPHRRNSFEAVDTMALSSHCLKGWTASQPSTMPAASSVSLRDSSKGIKAALKTTLHDAETLAANYPYEWNPAEQSISRPLPRPSYRPEAAYTESNFPYAVRESNFSQHGLKKATDDLLDSTYGLMYEMQRLKMERSDDPIRV